MSTILFYDKSRYSRWWQSLRKSIFVNAYTDKVIYYRFGKNLRPVTVSTFSNLEHNFYAIFIYFYSVIVVGSIYNIVEPLL